MVNLVETTLTGVSAFFAVVETQIIIKREWRVYGNESVLTEFK